jgi:molecular chaperone DnaK
MYSAERSLRDLGDKIPAGEREKAQQAIDAVKKALEGQDIERIRTAADELQRAFAKVSELAYQQAAGAQTAGAGTRPEGGEPGQAAGGEGGDEGVIDAEFRESD